MSDILIIIGTNRKNSKSAQIANIYNTIIQSKGLKTDFLDLVNLPADFTVSALYENNGKNEVFNTFRAKIVENKKFIFIVPEYNGSFPGVLKSLIDGLKYPDSFKNKKAALVGLSSGIMGGALAMSHLTDILNYLNMNVMGNKVKLMHIEKNFEDGKITNELYNTLINNQIEDFLAF
jgi:NAD(P)H-dependent FMN reductase